VRRLRGIAREGRDDARSRAVWLLGAIGPPARGAISELKEIAAGDDRALAQFACVALGKLATEDGPSLLPLFVAEIRRHPKGLTQASVEALGWMGPAAAETIPLLEELWDWESPARQMMRAKILIALLRMGPAGVRSMCTLAKLRPPAHLDDPAEVLETLESGRLHGDRPVRYAIRAALDELDRE
jgi:hypothetical protein